MPRLRVLALWDHELQRHCTLLVVREHGIEAEELVTVDLCRQGLRVLVRRLNEVLEKWCGG